MNPNSMLFWWPKVAGLIPTPQTALVSVEDKDIPLMWAMLDGNGFPDSLTARLGEAIQSSGLPAFVRGDLTSGKHDYPATCLVTSLDTLAQHVFSLVEASLLGPEALPQAFAVRELLELEAPFKAFKGLPIARERRVFAEAGKVMCAHPYWPEHAIKFFGIEEPKGWQAMLRTLSENTAEDTRTLSEYASALSQRLEGAWSLDFAKATSGVWYFIDAAQAAQSWHPEHV